LNRRAGIILEVERALPPPPKWWKNTYFWIAGVLFLLGVWGLPFLAGEKAIRDPGQVRESNLWLIYWGGAAVMLVNGLLSHMQTVKHYNEVVEERSAT